MDQPENNLNLTSYFYDSIELLRTTGDIILHSSFVQWSEDDSEYVTNFLREEYEKEAIHLPGELPEFDAAAAIWGAKITFVSAQLLMLREVEGLDFTKALLSFEGEKTISAFLSADLCLRFLPEIIEKAIEIDPYDELVDWLDQILIEWHYSGIGRRIVKDDVKINSLELVSDPMMQILYSNRILKRKAEHSVHEEIKHIVKPYLQ